MANPSTAPSTPEPKKKAAIGRSFTVPAQAATSVASSPIQPDSVLAQVVESLFVHPTCTVVKFTTSSILQGSTVGSGKRGLRWTSPTERTVAAGMLEIYRVPGTVAFLHSGDLLHPILPRSQCWCVDGVSKFALRISPDTYYRMELPGVTKEDLEAVDAFKVVLSKVMHFERTTCPFAREDGEELPELEDSRTKIFSRSDKAKQWKMDKTFSWKNDEGNMVKLRSTGSPFVQRKFSDNVSSHAFGTEIRPQEDSKPRVADLGRKYEQHAITTDSFAATQYSPSQGPADDAEGERSMLQGEEAAIPGVETIDGLIEHLALHLPEPASDEAPQTAVMLRERDEGMSPTLQSPEPVSDDPPMSNMLQESDERTSDLADTVQPVEHKQEADGANQETIVEQSRDTLEEPLASSESASSKDVAPLVPFHSLQQIPTDMPPSPPDSSAGFVPVDDRAADSEPHQPSHPDLQAEYDLDGATLVPQEEAGIPAVDATVDESNQTLVHPRDLPIAPSSRSTSTSRQRRESSQEDPFAAIQARILARRSIGGTTSFYPPVTRESTSTSTASVSSSLSSRSRVPIAHQRNLATALVHKACTVFLGPPAYLVAMMLRIAARFASGKLGGFLNLDGDVSTIDGSVGSYHIRGGSSASEEEEDDYGVSINSPIRIAAVKNLRERRVTEGWDLD